MLLVYIVHLELLLDQRPFRQLSLGPSTLLATLRDQHRIHDHLEDHQILPRYPSAPSPTRLYSPSSGVVLTGFP